MIGVLIAKKVDREGVDLQNKFENRVKTEAWKRSPTAIQVSCNMLGQLLSMGGGGGQHKQAGKSTFWKKGKG